MHDTMSESELFPLEHALWHEATRYDAAFQQKHFAPDFFEFGRSGQIHSRADCLITDGQAIHAHLSCLQARKLAPGTWLVTYDSSVPDPSGNRLHAHRSSIWSWLDGRWQLRFHQGTPCEAPCTNAPAR
ncbi:nuclear transport factor 2 family protein [Kerstersia gyiorum]|nr:nuclear transport factor 2 family protein [Kerstersia gyiorum]